MAIVDDRGRLFGRWNLLDVALLVVLVGLIPLGYAAYVLFREQPPRLVSVTPSQLPQAPDMFTVTITGEHLRPYMRVSAGTQQGRAFLFKSTEEAEVPFSALPPGRYDIVLFDQAQERFRLRDALTITPTGLPATQVVAIGAFGNLDAAGAAKFTAGAELPGAGTVLEVGQPEPDVTQVFAGAQVVNVPSSGTLRLPASLTLSCQVSVQSGTPFCSVGDVTLRPTVLLMLPTPIGKTPFQLERVRGPQPLTTVSIDVLLAGPPGALSAVAPGDLDLGGTTNQLALLSRVVSAGAPLLHGPGAAQRRVTLAARLQQIGDGWHYDSTPIRIGSQVRLRTSRYDVTGTVLTLPPPALLY